MLSLSNALILFLPSIILCSNAIINCRNTLEDRNIKYIEWSYLKECLILVNGEDMSKNISQNIWNLTKLAFDGADNIPYNAYRYMGYALTAIPLSELSNISMENVEIIEAFGLIKSSNSKQHQDGFSEKQLKLIARKVRTEWLDKNALTYSEYDLKILGQILCYLKVQDIEKIHADALKQAAEWIGSIEKCPFESLQALSNLAKTTEAFGEPKTWSTLEVAIIGNILNGLSHDEINSIDLNKLQLNYFYNVAKNSQMQFNTRKSCKEE